MRFFPKKIVGIDIHDYSAQVVELKLFKEKISLEAYNRILISPGVIHNGEILKIDELRLILAKLLKEANPKPIKANKIAIVFPSAKVFSHIFTFPVILGEDEIREALPYEAEKVIPFAIKDVYWDFTVLEAESREKKHASKYVLFSAIPKEIADKFVELFAPLKLAPCLFGAQIEALKYGLIKQVDILQNDLIINVGTLSVDYLILKGSTIKHFFSSNKGGKHLIASLVKEFQSPENTIIDQKENNLLDAKYLPLINVFLAEHFKIGDKIIKEAEKKSDIGRINSIYLTGEFLNLPNFIEITKQYFPNKNIYIGDPRKYLDINVNKFKSLEKGKDAIYYSTYFINAVGVALRGLITAIGNGINLLPDKLRESFANKKMALILAVSAVAMSCIALFIGTGMSFMHQNLIFERHNLEIQKTAVDKMLFGIRYQEIRDAIIKFNEEVNTMTNIEKTIFSMPVLIDDIKKIMPPGIKLTNLKYNDIDLTVEISGIADTREDLLELNKNFKESALINKVITPISNYDEKQNISFNIKIELIFKELPKYGASANTK